MSTYKTAHTTYTDDDCPGIELGISMMASPETGGHLRLTLRGMTEPWTGTLDDLHTIISEHIERGKVQAPGIDLAGMVKGIVGL